MIQKLPLQGGQKQLLLEKLSLKTMLKESEKIVEGSLWEVRRNLSLLSTFQ